MGKTVLLVCMVDSIHTARWIQNTKEKNIEITIFPSQKFKYIHKEIISIIEDDPKVTFLGIRKNKFFRIFGYIDFILDKLFKFLLKKNFRETLLEFKIRKSHFDFVHALESQSAGYLCARVLNQYPTIPLILNCWGSDLYFYKNRIEHQSRLFDLLNRVNYFSADCRRDYLLAKQYGFHGISLPVIPSIEPVHRPIEYKDLIQFKDRNLILIKGYGALFGNLEAILPDLENILISYDWVNLKFYSLDKEYIGRVELLASKYPERVTHITNSKPVSNKEMQSLFRQSFIHIGYSKSDGLPAAVLESMKWGAYPIQTNTSCLQELILDGACASLIPLSEHHLQQEVEEVINNLPRFEDLVKNNIDFVNQNYSYLSIEKLTSDFYK
jgi:glycosyltransferase involved in cell wall biosynthesis